MKKLNLLGTAVLCTIFLGCSAGSSSPDYLALLINTEKQTPQSSTSSKPSESSTPSKPSESTLPLFKFSGNENYVSAKNVSASDAENQSTGLEADWWKKTSFYHVWVKSFSDSDGDGCGDLNGVKQKLDYIQNEIGCDGIWLSPIFECNYKTKTGNMHGYDTTDYYAVNDFFGTEEDLISLINAAHERGMKVIFDYVPNHTSSSNDWFKDSVAEQNGKKDWFMWNTTQLNWDNSMGTGHWYNLNGSNKYYYGAFGSGMPDFNFRNYEVREEMKNVARYWLNKGFDGIRVDAARYLIEDDGKYYDTEGSHTWFKELRKELDKYASPKFMMCEVWGPDHEVEESYLGNGTDEFHMTLDFHQGSDCIKSVSYQRNFIKNTLYPNKSETTGFATFMVNHDEYNNRIATTFKGDQKLQKLATALSLLRPTVPIIYYGTEIGLKNTSSGGDSALRGNFDWSLAEEQMTTEKSLLKLNNAINSFRKTHASSFADADVKHLTASITSTAAYIISGKKDNTKFLCVYNLSSKACDSADFTGCNSFSSSSCIMGDTEAPELSLSGTTVSVKKIAPFSFRVYALDATESNIWDDEEYKVNDSYTAANDEPYVHKNYTVMYIRGDMNGWGGTLMNLNSDGKTFSCTTTFTNSSNPSAATVTLGFKFCESDSSWDLSWGVEETTDNPYGNIIRTFNTNVPYVITFNPYTGEFSINQVTAD